MAKPRESSKSAVLVAGLLLVPMLLLCCYVAAYFVCSESYQGPPGRWFANERQALFFYPQARLEQSLRGPNFAIGHDDFIQPIGPLPSFKITDYRNWTATDGREFIAEFIERTGDTVRLRTSADEVIEVPLDSLREWDREWVDEQASH
jgi:hypothetical protein